MFLSAQARKHIHINSQKTTWRTWNLFQLKGCRAIECHSLIIIMNREKEKSLGMKFIAWEADKWKWYDEKQKKNKNWLFSGNGLLFRCEILITPVWYERRRPKITMKYEINYRRTIIYCAFFRPIWKWKMSMEYRCLLYLICHHLFVYRHNKMDKKKVFVSMASTYFYGRQKKKLWFIW